MKQVVCFTASLVLQAPPAVFEGDSVVLRCHTEESVKPETLTFYKNGLPLPHQSSELHITRANLKDNGKYECTKKNWFREPTISNKVRIQVQGTALIILNRSVRGRLLWLWR